MKTVLEEWMELKEDLGELLEEEQAIAADGGPNLIWNGA